MLIERTVCDAEADSLETFSQFGKFTTSINVYPTGVRDCLRVMLSKWDKQIV